MNYFSFSSTQHFASITESRFGMQMFVSASILHMLCSASGGLQLIFIFLLFFTIFTS
ncbi:hypothetical protein SAMN02745751_01233 [Dethiosulfatibacter aminovorans DSM 17477]|uniref:Uncharacterized protein n=1 Tax=Dethiosulfatibacter aminovorans DSM 17477 TaxID=1121476 RepID=A0A1M6EL61_9FIRM|nr:hypothetical protein SAMN02745751_01233 [Dethiosulfatibacter aminovorans DSM 17477]